MKKFIFIIVVCSFLLIGCGSSNKFLGTWYFEYNGEALSVTFNDNGSCYVEIMSNNYKYNCKYEYDDEKIKVSSEDGSLSYETEYIFNGDIVVVDGIKFYKNLNEFNSGTGYVKDGLVTVPDVTGLFPSEAEEVLTKKGFNVKIVEEYSDTVPESNLIRIEPESGTKALKGSEIIIYKASK